MLFTRCLWVQNKGWSGLKSQTTRPSFSFRHHVHITHCYFDIGYTNSGLTIRLEMAPKKAFTGHLGDLLEPLPPVDQGVRTPVNIRRSKPFKSAPTRDLDVFFTPSPSQSSLTARPRGKQMMPSSSTVVQQPSKIPHRRAPIVEPRPPPPPPAAAKESQESIVPDSEPERRANTCNSSAVEEESV